MEPAFSAAEMEPLLPPDGVHAVEDLALELTGKAGALAALVHPLVRQSIGEL